MATMEHLVASLRRLDGRGYKAYKSIAGTYGVDGYELRIDHVQGDPFADPSRTRVVLPPKVAGLPDWALSNAIRRRATADFINRSFARALERISRPRGSGKSGLLKVLRPGQEVLLRSSVVVEADGELEVRFSVGLPAHGRRIAGREAVAMLAEDVPAAVQTGLVFEALCEEDLRRQVECVEDACALRDQLDDRGWVAFVGDGSVLARRSGVDDRPLTAEGVVPFQAPESLRVTLSVPNGGDVSGMAIPKGVTLIVGGGYHGKSTLLRAIERGVYDHIPGDGRERVVTVADAVKIRAEDGRSVAGTDISNFIDRLPDGQDTSSFATENASGSTSQAAALVEALEVGASCLLLDEDTSATNFMIRDARMQALVQREHEPITPFIDRVRVMADELGVSTLVVVGGAGDYFDVADTVVAMRGYRPRDVSAEARSIAEQIPSRRVAESGRWQALVPRIVHQNGLDPGRGRRSQNIKLFARDRLVYGEQEVDLAAVEQLVEAAQTRAMAHALAWGRGRYLDGKTPVGEALVSLMKALDDRGLDALDERPRGDFAAFRVQELASLLNRMRRLSLG